MRPAADVLRRARAMLALADRGFIEAGTHDDAAGALRSLRDRVALFGLRDALDPADVALLDMPHGALERAHVLLLTNRLEQAAVLAWALALAPLPLHDEPAEASAAADALWEPPTTPALRSMDELRRTAARLAALADRLRSPSTAVDLVRLSDEQGFDLFGIATLDRDLAIAGAPITRADPDHVRIAAAIAPERLAAITWLLE